MGISVIYGSLLLFYALEDSEVPMRAKTTIIGALGYGDDLTAIITALGIIYIYLTHGKKTKVRKKAKELFRNATEENFSTIENMI